MARPISWDVGRMKHARYSRHLPVDLMERLNDFLEASDTTLELEALANATLSQYADAYRNEEITRDQWMTTLLATMESVSRATERRINAEYKRDNLVSLPELIAIFKAIASAIDVRISNKEEGITLAQDIAAILRGKRGVIGKPHYEHPETSAGSAIQVIDDNLL
jgi:hypothetical protein